LNFQTAVIRGERARIHFDNAVKRWRAAVLIQKYTRRRIAATMFNDQLKHIILLQSGNSYAERGSIIIIYLYCPKVVHLSNHVLLYVSAVMRGCLARMKYKCLQNEEESKVSHNKVQGDMRKNISESRVCHVSSMSKDIILLSLPIS
jgi:myosin V